MNKVIAIDIGGTSFKGAFVEDGIISNKIEMETHHEDGLDGFKKTLYKIVKTLLDIENVDKIGISSVGNINNVTGEIVGSTNWIKGLNGFNIVKFIKDNFNKETYVDNDAFCALYGELYYGNAKGYKDVCMLTLGTGVGGAVAIDSKVLHGKDFTAGRLGHIILFPDGLNCQCGNKGCIEMYLSGRAFSDGVKKLGYNIKGIETFDLIKKGDKVLEEYCINFFKNLEYVFKSLENMYNPELVLIGGGLSNSYSEWEKYIPNINSYSFKILPAKLKNNAGIIGASTLTNL